MCSNCGRSSVVSMGGPVRNRSNISYTAVEDCSYTIPVLQNWLQKLLCTKEKQLYNSLGITPKTMNKYLGVVLSALNNPNQPCYYASLLAPVANFIVLIVNSGKC